MSENDIWWLVFWVLMGNYFGNLAVFDNYVMGKYVVVDIIMDWVVEIIGYIFMEVGQYNFSGVMFEVGVGFVIIGG